MYYLVIFGGEISFNRWRILRRYGFNNYKKFSPIFNHDYRCNLGKSSVWTIFICRSFLLGRCRKLFCYLLPWSVSLCLITGDFLPTTQMFVALFAYFLYFINAFQFLRKLRLARQTDQKTALLEYEVSKWTSTQKLKIWEGVRRYLYWKSVVKEKFFVVLPVSSGFTEKSRMHFF